MSNFATDHNRLFSNLEHALANDMATIAVQANGGRSILFCYPHEEDNEYIEEGRRRLDPTSFEFVDIRDTFAAFVKEIGEETFNEMLENYGKEVYRSENFSEGTFFHYLMNRISAVIDSDKSPVLVHTGALYDMEFSNIHIMEDPRVLRAKRPLVVFYPATIEGETIKFLGMQVASRYRCIVVK